MANSVAKDYVTKIRNLLDLAQSPNEHEARSALLKARQLMVKHKIAERDLGNVDGQSVEEKGTDITYSARRDPWVNELAVAIASHHCCKQFQLRRKGKQTAEIGFVGFEEDLAVCMEVFKYAVDCVRSMTNGLRRKNGVKAADGYGFGFVKGLMEAYDKQQKQEGWGLALVWSLALVTPEAVNDHVERMTKRKNYSIAKKLQQSDIHSFRKGIQDGREFDMTRRLKEGNA